MNEKIWDAIKKAGLLLAVIIALTQIWDWIGDRSSNLVAEVEFGSYVVPPTLLSQLERLYEDSYLRDHINFDRMLSSVQDSSARSRLEEDIIDSFSSFLFGSIPDALKYADSIWGPRGYWGFRIENDGQKTLESVVLTIPDAKYASVKREGGVIESLEGESVIRLNAMQPQEIIDIIVWTSDEPRVYQADEIKLTHAEGIGKIVLRAPAGPFWHWMERNLLFLTFIGVWILATALLLLLGYFHSKRKSNNSSSEEVIEDGSSNESNLTSAA